MSILMVNFSKKSNFEDSVKTAKSELNKRVDDYSNISKRILSIPSGTKNCSSCASYLKKKNIQLQEKVTKLNSLKDQVTDFVEDVERTDRKVASRIRKDTKKFTKKSGIGKSNKSLWSTIVDGAKEFFEWLGNTLKHAFKDAVAAVKEFYEKNKYWINIVVDAVAVIAAVATLLTGAGAVAFGVNLFLLVDAGCDLGYDIKAQIAHNAGDDAEAERLAEKGGRDTFVFLGGKLDDALGTNCFAGGMGLLHSGLSIFAVGYSFYKTGSQLKKDLKLKDVKTKSYFNSDRKRIKWKSHVNKDTLKTSAKNYFGFKKRVVKKDLVKQLWAKPFHIGEKILKKPAAAKKLVKIIKTYNSIKCGKKVVKTLKKGYQMIKTRDFNPFTKTKKAIKENINSWKFASSGGY